MTELRNILTPKSLDAANSKLIAAADAQPGNPWIGGWTEIHAAGFIRQITLVASSVVSGLGGTFTFQYSADAVTASVTETRVIRTFSAVRSFNLLGVDNYYRVKFEPSRALAGDTVYVGTTHHRTDPGPFVYTPGSTLEIENHAHGTMGVFLKGWEQATGNSVNLSLVPQTNTTGTFQTIPTIPAGPPSAMLGRTRQSFAIDALTASQTLLTNPVGKIVYVTDLVIGVTNTSAVGPANVRLRDGGVSGPILLTIQAQEGTAQQRGTAQVSKSYVEPIRFDTSIYLQIVTPTTTTVWGGIRGYSE